jgi:hypothetical protein
MKHLVAELTPWSSLETERDVNAASYRKSRYNSFIRNLLDSVTEKTEQDYTVAETL